MKKYVLSILSLILLFSSVLAEDINLNRGPESFISFEDLNSSHNITYGFYRIGGSYATYERSFTYYLNSSLVPQYSINYFDSVSVQTGINYNTDLGSPFIISGNSYNTLSNEGNYYGLLGIGFINGKLIRTSFSSYFQTGNGLNKVINFSSEFNTGINFSQIKHSFVRVLYDYSSSSGLWFLDNNSPVTSSEGPPTDIQLFIRDDDRVYTSKGMAGINQKITKVSSSAGNGFSFFPELSGSIFWDSIKMYSVFPYWDSDFDGTFYTIPDSKYSSDFYIFKMNSLGRNTDLGHIGVISKCNISICSGFDLQSYLSSLVFSEYYCDFSSNFGIKNNCNLVDGGFLYNVLGSITGLNSIIDINSLPNFLGNIQYYSNYYPSVGVNFNFTNRNLVFSYWTKTTSSNSTPPKIYSSSFPVLYTGIYNSTFVPDILGTYDYINPLPPSSNSSGFITTGLAVSGSINKCLFDINYYHLNSLFCNSLGVYIGADGVPILNTSSSGSCLKIIQAFNDSGDLIELTVSCDEAQNFLSGGFYQDSQGNIFYKCFGDTCLYTNTSQYFQSGIVSDSYYNSDSLFFSCPYPIITGSNNILSRFSNLQLGQYSIGLPILCFYSSFVAGKNYKLFSGFDSGLSQPLFGFITSSSDDRVYLFKFLDIILGLGILFFLLKLYHLTK